MPVSSPSYFPPNSSTDQVKGINTGINATGAPIFLAGQKAGLNSTVNNLLIIGHLSGSGGITDPNIAGTIILGDSSAVALVQRTITAPNTPAANIVIGTNSLQAVPQMDSTIAIGEQIYQLTTSPRLTGNVLIGNGIGATVAASLVSRSVIIGHQAGGNPANSDINVTIGYQALTNATIAGVQNVFIGGGVGPTSGSTGGGSLQQNVVIGCIADCGGNASTNVVIGFNAKCSQQTGGAGGNNVGIGANSTCAVPTDQVGGNTVLGNGAQIPLSTVNGQNIIIGSWAGLKFVGTSQANISNALVIETNNATNTAFGALVFGFFTTGNMVIGRSTPGVDREFGGTSGNVLKLLNGNVGSTNPIGGGYFYVIAGVLHWVDSNGVDTTVSSPAAPATGASTATFVATNKPGATTGAGPVAWENRVINGVSYQSPLWAT